MQSMPMKNARFLGELLWRLILDATTNLQLKEDAIEAVEFGLY